MPWEKQFDEDVVLEKAMRAFWRGGFKGTSMKDLVRETGLNPGSIYAAFKDKEHLFQRCLAKYEVQAEEDLASLQRTFSPKNTILALFDAVFDDTQSGEEACGCFLMNSILETGPQEDDVTRTIRKGLETFEGLIRALIEKGQATGEIPSDLDAANTARLIQGLLAGARLMGRARADHPFVKEAREHAEKLLS